MVELYPGLFVKEANGRMNPGSGACPPYTVSRAVLSDAVTLVRSDRFYTLVEITPSNLSFPNRWLTAHAGLYGGNVDQLGYGRC